MGDFSNQVQSELEVEQLINFLRCSVSRSEERRQAADVVEVSVA